MSPATPSTCARCGGALSEGFLLDHGHGNAPMPAEWVEDPPVKSFWTGLKLKDKEHIPVRAFRCERCGLLEFRASSPS